MVGAGLSGVPESLGELHARQGDIESVLTACSPIETPIIDWINQIDQTQIQSSVQTNDHVLLDWLSLARVLGDHGSQAGRQVANIIFLIVFNQTNPSRLEDILDHSQLIDASVRASLIPFFRTRAHLIAEVPKACLDERSQDTERVEEVEAQMSTALPLLQVHEGEAVADSSYDALFMSFRMSLNRKLSGDSQQVDSIADQISDWKSEFVSQAQDLLIKNHRASIEDLESRQAHVWDHNRLVAQEMQKFDQAVAAAQNSERAIPNCDNQSESLPGNLVSSMREEGADLRTYLGLVDFISANPNYRSIFAQICGRKKRSLMQYQCGDRIRMPLRNGGYIGPDGRYYLDP